MPVIQVCKTPAFARDRRLSYKARGLLAFILSHEHDWEIHVETLIKESDEDGRAAVQTGLQELTRLGYATLELERDPQGHVRGRRYFVYDTPNHAPKHRQAENRSVGADEPKDRKTGFRSFGEENHENNVVPSDDRQTENQVFGLSAEENHRQTINQVFGSTKDLDLKTKEEEPPIVPHSAQAAPVQDRQDEVSAEYSAKFEKFWHGYPLKKNKGDAWRKWKQEKCERICEDIMRSVEAHKLDYNWIKESGRFVPYPATFLHRKGWEDELSPDTTISTRSNKPHWG